MSQNNTTNKQQRSHPLFEKDDDVAKLKEKLQKTTAVLATQKIALWEYDIKNQKCYFPEEYFRILGLDEAGIVFGDLYGLYEFVHPDDKSFINAEAFQKKLDGNGESSVCIRCIGTHGEMVWLEDHFFSVLKDENGEPEKLMSYTVNVTAQREKEARILGLEDRNRKIIDALPEFIFIFDRDFFIVDVLMSQKTVLLHPVEQLKGADGRSIYSEEVSDLFIRNIQQCLQDSELKEIEYSLDVENKERHYFQARIAPFENNLVLALIHDIGDRVQRSNELIEAKKRAEEADRMKSVFLANMSHEIRTPLNAIVGFSEIIAVTEDADEKAEYLDIVHKNSNLLLQLINDVLDLSRIESGKSEMNLQPVEMTGLIDEVGKVHELKMKNGIKLKVICPQTEIWTLIDRNRITQVLFNFLSNAIKNTAEGSITLGLEQHKDSLKLYVTDTGCGIPKDKVLTIFNRFEKLNDFVQGTGLGLSICQSIVEHLGGRIDVQSEFGVGSTFTIHLPYYQIKLDEEGKLLNQDTDFSISGKEGCKKILIAEDVEANFMQINILLKRDFTISWATNGEEAVNSFLRERPDLILMDIRMPVMNGIQATEKIRAMAPDLPIIAVTANAYFVEQQQALAAGCNDLIAKPYTFDKLRETISKYI